MELLKSIDIALAMIVVYLTFSLGVTALNESIAAVMSSRARWLRKGIGALLTGEPDSTTATESSSATDASIKNFYRSPYISALGSTHGWQPRFAPSYIPSWTMLQGLLDSAAGASGIALSTLDEVKAAAAKLPDKSPIKVALTDLISQADGNLAKLKDLVEAFFKSFDEQVAAWYRQKTQHVLVGLSLLVVLGMNLDTVAMFRMLSADTKLRSALVEQALESAKKSSADDLLNLKPLQDARQALVEAKKPGTSEADLKAAQDRVDAERQALEKVAKDLVSSVEATSLPLGWSKVDVNSLGGLDWLMKIVGLALSTFALSLGAPFWFDMLQKLASIRAVGKNPTERQNKKAS